MLVRWNVCCFTIHMPTFITHYWFRHINSVRFVVSIPPHRVFLFVAWFIAEVYWSSWWISRKNSTDPNQSLSVKRLHAGDLRSVHGWRTSCETSVLCMWCMSSRGKLWSELLLWRRSSGTLQSPYTFPFHILLAACRILYRNVTEHSDRWEQMNCSVLPCCGQNWLLVTNLWGCGWENEIFLSVFADLDLTHAPPEQGWMWVPLQWADERLGMF